MLECNPNGLSPCVGLTLATGLGHGCPKEQATYDLLRILETPTINRESDEDRRALLFLRENADKSTHG